MMQTGSLLNLRYTALLLKLKKFNSMLGKLLHTICGQFQIIANLSAIKKYNQKQNVQF